jgi:hypothetical protein
VAALVGLPTYQLALDQIGKLAGRLSLQRMQVSLKSKPLLMGGSCRCLLHHADELPMATDRQPDAAYGRLADTVCLTGVTPFSIRSIAQALNPFST